MDRFITQVIFTQSCEKHGVECGDPCFVVQSRISRTKYAGVCNDRAIFAGMVGTISPSSITQRNTNRSRKPAHISN